MKKKGRSFRYKLSYVAFWSAKGLYGDIRIVRTKTRKQKRYEKWLQRRRDDSFKPWWENGRMVHHCEMGGTCEWPCNGDC